MLANIPFEIQKEILIRVHPVKFLLRFRLVSKLWKSLIDSSKFITKHSLNKTRPQHLLVNYNIDSQCKLVSLVDDDSFPDNRFSHIIPHPVRLAGKTKIVGSSHGLVCLYTYAQYSAYENSLVVVWNPSIRKYVGIVLPLNEFTTLRFGVCPKTSEPKIVKITSPREINIDNQKVENFTLSSGVWRNKSMNLSYKSRCFMDKQVVIEGVIYWVAYMSNPSFINSFDLTSEEFGEVNLSNSLPHLGDVSISKLKDSLVVLNTDFVALVCDVWKMVNNGDMNSSFVRIFTFDHRTSNRMFFYSVVGFRENGEVLRQRIRLGDDSQVTTLERYVPGMQHSIDLEFEAIYKEFFMMNSYKESLILLNQPDSITHFI